MRAFLGHRKFVQSVAFSPDGATLASASADHTIKLWNVATGEERRTLEGHNNWVTSVAYSPDGNRLISGGHDGTVRLWPRPGGKKRPEGQVVGPPDRKGTVSCVAFAPDRSRFAWGSYLGNVCTCPTAQPEQPTALRAGGTMIFCLAFAPDSATLAAGGNSGTVQVWDLRSNTILARLTHGDEQGCRALAYSPTGQALALALGSGVEIWQSRPAKLLARLTDHTDVVSSTAYAPDGRRLLTASWDGTVRLYDIDPTTSAPLALRACLDWGLGKLFDVTFAPDGMTAACSGHDEDRVVLWDVE